MGGEDMLRIIRANFREHPFKAEIMCKAEKKNNEGNKKYPSPVHQEKPILLWHIWSINIDIVLPWSI